MHLDQRFPCKLCDYQATIKSSLATHVRFVHQNSEDVTCVECNKTVKKYHLSKHMKVLHSEKQKKYNCSICSFQTIHQNGLKQHFKGVHLKDEKKKE